MPDDFTEIYERQIEPLLVRAGRIAQQHGIPFVTTFQVRSEREGVAGYASRIHDPEGCGGLIEDRAREIREACGGEGTG